MLECLSVHMVIFCLQHWTHTLSSSEDAEDSEKDVISFTINIFISCSKYADSNFFCNTIKLIRAIKPGDHWEYLLTMKLVWFSSRFIISAWKEMKMLMKKDRTNNLAARHWYWKWIDWCTARFRSSARYPEHLQI